MMAHHQLRIVINATADMLVAAIGPRVRVGILFVRQVSQSVVAYCVGCCCFFCDVGFFDH